MRESVHCSLQSTSKRETRDRHMFDIKIDDAHENYSHRKCENCCFQMFKTKTTTTNTKTNVNISHWENFRSENGFTHVMLWIRCCCCCFFYISQPYRRLIPYWWWRHTKVRYYADWRENIVIKWKETKKSANKSSMLSSRKKNSQHLTKNAFNKTSTLLYRCWRYEPVELLCESLLKYAITFYLEKLCCQFFAVQHLPDRSLGKIV